MDKKKDIRKIIEALQDLRNATHAERVKALELEHLDTFVNLNTVYHGLCDQIRDLSQFCRKHC